MNKSHILSIVWCSLIAVDMFSMQVHTTQHAKLNICVTGIAQSKGEQKEISRVIEVLSKDLAFSGQFSTHVTMLQEDPSPKKIKQLCKDGFPLAVFVKPGDRPHTFDWRLYDTLQPYMIKGQRYKKRGRYEHGWAHNIADALWPVLTGQESSYSSKIAYCKDVQLKDGKRVKHVCIADYDGSREQVIVDTPTVNVAPRWHTDAKRPLLFYSEFTNANVRLNAVNMKKKRKVTSNFDGINMQAGFSSDGKEVVYCASRGDGNCQIYHYKKGSFKKLTHNQGTNIAPVMAKEFEKVFFCSDFKTGLPQIFALDIETGDIERITKGGYCASPCYCPKNKKLLYTKKVNGRMQICCYDITTKKHSQLTTDAMSKEECAWSPCGNYVIYSQEAGNKSSIAMMNLLTKTKHIITSESTRCSYPAWSPKFDRVPIVYS